MNKKQGFGYSIQNAIHGIYIGLKEHRNLKIMAIIAILTVGLGFYLKLNRFEWALIWLSISSVLCLEMINTAIEELLNHLHPEFHQSIGKAKDIAAGAVLLACIFAGIAGLYIVIIRIVY